MKKSKLSSRILSVLLCAVMILGIFGGCASGEGDASGSKVESTPKASGVSSTGGEEKGPLYIEGSEGVTLTYWIPMSDQATQEFSSYAEHPYFQWLKEQTGVNIEFIHPTIEQQDQQLNLMIASGEYYDMLMEPWYPGGPQAGIDEGCFIDLYPYLDEYMPDYKAALECNDGSFADWEWGPERELYQPQPQPSFKTNLTTASGALYTVSQIWTNAYYPEAGPVIRKDWLDEAGLEVPETLDELEVVLEAFKQRGEDVIPMNLGAGQGQAEGVNSADCGIISAFGLANYFQINKERTEVLPHFYTQDSFKDYLTLMQDWYAKGYIDPDFMNRDSEALSSLFLSDRLGIFFSNFTMPDQWKDSYTGDQDFDVVAMPLPRKTKDQHLEWVHSYASCPTMNTSITTSCEHPEIAAAWLNVGFTKEGILRRTYGIEGDTYELRDGVPYYTDKVYNMNSAEYDSFVNCFLYPIGTGYCSVRADLIRGEAGSTEKLSSWAETEITWSQNASPDTYWGYVVFSDDGWGQFDTAYNDAATYGTPMVLKFIIGEESLDKFDEFREKCKSLGLDRAQTIAQEALDAMNGKGQ